MLKFYNVKHTNPGSASTTTLPPPDLLLIGHVTRDLIDPSSMSNYRLGGTVSFAAVTALRLGRKPTVLTRASEDTRWDELPPEIVLNILPSPATTTFANVYTKEGRVQYTYAQASPIEAEDVPVALHNPSAVLLGPLVDEISPKVASIFAPQTLVAAVPQGWMRRWDKSGRIFSVPWAAETEVLPHLDVLVLSQEDIAYDLKRLDRAFSVVPLVVLTEYKEGSTIYQQLGDGSLEEIKIPPRPAREVDPTGAGDVFATAFLLRYQETGDAVHSARFANVTASFGVEAVGVSGVPSRQQVLEYMARYPVR